MSLPTPSSSIHTPNPDANNYRFFARLPDGRSLLSCHAQNAVLVADERGEVVGKVADVPFSRPEGIAVNGKGQVFIADSHHHCIHVLDERLALQRSIVTDHQPVGRLNQPVGIAASDDRIWVADSENHRVLVLSTKGEHLSTLGGGYGRAPFCPCGG
jgi:DNA-binding beta-propeller fold protein YncE